MTGAVVVILAVCAATIGLVISQTLRGADASDSTGPLLIVVVCIAVVVAAIVTGCTVTPTGQVVPADSVVVVDERPSVDYAWETLSYMMLAESAVCHLWREDQDWVKRQLRSIAERPIGDLMIGHKAEGRCS